MVIPRLFEAKTMAIPSSQTTMIKIKSPEINFWTNKLVDKEMEHRIGYDLLIWYRPFATVFLALVACVLTCFVILRDQINVGLTDVTAVNYLIISFSSVMIILLMRTAASRYIMVSWVVTAFIMLCVASRAYTLHECLSRNNNEHVVTDKPEEHAFSAEVAVIAEMTSIGYPLSPVQFVIVVLSYASAVSAVFVYHGYGWYESGLFSIMLSFCMLMLAAIGNRHQRLFKYLSYYNRQSVAQRGMLLKLYESIVPMEYVKQDGIGPVVPKLLPDPEMFGMIYVVRCRLFGLSKLFSISKPEAAVNALKNFHRNCDRAARRVGAIRLPFGIDECAYVLGMSHNTRGHHAVVAVTLGARLKTAANGISFDVNETVAYRSCVCVSCGSGVATMSATAGMLPGFVFSGRAYAINELMMDHVMSRDVAVSRAVALDIIRHAHNKDDITFYGSDGNNVDPMIDWDFCYARMMMHDDTMSMSLSMSMPFSTNHSDAMFGRMK